MLIPPVCTSITVLLSVIVSGVVTLGILSHPHSTTLTGPPSVPNSGPLTVSLSTALFHLSTRENVMNLNKQFLDWRTKD